MITEEVVLIALGAVSAPAFALCVAAVALIRRGRRYSEAKSEQSAPAAFVPSLAGVVRSEEQKELDSTFYRLLQVEHETAKKLQNRSFFSLILASAALLLAFAVSAASVTIAAGEPAIHLYSAALDLAALLVVGVAFVHSGATRTKWIRQRALTEFLRQWAVVDLVFGISDEPLAQRFGTFTERVRNALVQAKRDIHAAVLEFGAVRLREIRKQISGTTSSSSEDLRYYLLGRSVRQAVWFGASQARIAEHQESRKGFMIWLFSLAALAAGLKLGALLFLDAHDGHALAAVAMFALLLIIGLAAASTSTYVGQNQRSLRHRYHSQLVAIQSWFENEADVIELANVNRSITAPERRKIAAAVITFEGLMINELADWIAISTNDAMELAPA